MVNHLKFYFQMAFYWLKAPYWPKAPYWLIALIWIVFPGICYSEEESHLKIIVDKSQVEMGKYLSARIVYTGKHIPDSSHLEKWYDDFFVDRRNKESETLANSLIQTTEFLRLYPRATGNKVLHSIALGGAIAYPVKIKVIPVIRNQIDGTPHWQPLPETIWQGETIKLSISQNLLDLSNQIVIEDGLFTGFVTQLLDQKEVKNDNVEQKNQKNIQLSWLITANSPGTFQLEAPAIVQRGRGRWKFYLPRVHLKVKPLPSYIPPTIPVGKLSIQTGFFYAQKQAFWFVDLHNEGLLADEIYGMRTQLSELTGQPIETVTFSALHTQQNASLESVHRYQVAVPQWSWAFNEGPEIIVPYFDVLEGQIKRVSKKLPGVWNIPYTAIYVLLLVIGVIVMLVILQLFRGLKTILAWQTFSKHLNDSHTPYELRQLLLAQGSFLNLEQWSQAKYFYSRTNAAKCIARQLNRLCFSQLKNQQLINKTESPEVSINRIKYLLTELYTLKFWLMGIQSSKFRTCTNRP